MADPDVGLRRLAGTLDAAHRTEATIMNSKELDMSGVPRFGVQLEERGPFPCWQRMSIVARSGLGVGPHSCGPVAPDEALRDEGVRPFLLRHREEALETGGVDGSLIGHFRTGLPSGCMSMATLLPAWDATIRRDGDLADIPVEPAE